MTSPDLGRVGLWAMEMRFGDKDESSVAATELDELGYGTLWIPGGLDDAVLSDVERLLAVTERMTIATGILNIWKHNPTDVAAWFNGLPEAHQARTMIGIGVSHGPMIGEAWKKPLSAISTFLDGLEQGGMPSDNLCVAALGPKMLELSGNRTAGAHPYLVTPEHSSIARDILGDGKLVAPEQGVILESDPDKARQIAREGLTHYASLPNYRNNWARLGLSQADIDNVSDTLLDALFAWGDVDAVAQRVKAHHDAGADHVCVQLIRGATGGDIAGLRAACRNMAEVLL